MNNRERITAVFERRSIDRLVWQPRLHHWYDVNKARGTLPPRYVGWGLLGIYDDLGASPRGYHFFDDTIRTVEGEHVKVLVKRENDHIYTKYRTPKGSLTQVERNTEWGTATLRVEYMLKKTEDFKVLSYVLGRQRFEFDKELYRKRETVLGSRTEPSVNLPWGSIQRLFIVHMGFQNGVIALWKHCEKVEDLLKVYAENDDKRFMVIRKTPFKIINFGDNIDEGLCSPPIFRRYMLPYYQQRTKELHQVGKYCTSHWDGKVNKLLPFVAETGLDGLECIPPTPQGNVSLEELKGALENKVLFDGIPATHFLSTVSDKELESFVHRLLGMFKPNIVVGISDMLPPDGSIEKVRRVAEIISDYEV